MPNVRPRRTGPLRKKDKKSVVKPAPAPTPEAQRRAYAAGSARRRVVGRGAITLRAPGAHPTARRLPVALRAQWGVSSGARPSAGGCSRVCRAAAPPARGRSTDADCQARRGALPTSSAPAPPRRGRPSSRAPGARAAGAAPPPTATFRAARVRGGCGARRARGTELARVVAQSAAGCAPSTPPWRRQRAAVRTDGASTAAAAAVVHAAPRRCQGGRRTPASCASTSRFAPTRGGAARRWCVRRLAPPRGPTARRIPHGAAGATATAVAAAVTTMTTTIKMSLSNASVALRAAAEIWAC